MVLDLPNAKYVGLSLSFCVRDIMEGKIDEDRVMTIIAGTKFKDYEGWKRVIEVYSKTYWKSNPVATEIANRLMVQGKIVQPRLQEQDTPTLTGGHWSIVFELGI
jgi:hypothetical protein